MTTRILMKPAEALRLMLDRPDLFGAVAKDLDKQARTLLKKQIRAVRTLAAARELAAALGGELLATGLDALSATDVGALLNRLDKGNEALADMAALAQRQHLAGLIEGRLEPVKGRKPPARKLARPVPEGPVTEADRILQHKSMGARRKAKAG